MILYAILKDDGTYEGEHCKMGRAPNESYFDRIIPPQGHIKRLLTIEQYEELKFSWNREDEIGDKRLNLNTNRINKLSQSEKKAKKAARPKKYRTRLTENGDTERVEYTDPKNIDWTNSQVTPRE